MASELLWVSIVKDLSRGVDNAMVPRMTEQGIRCNLNPRYNHDPFSECLLRAGVTLPAHNGENYPELATRLGGGV